jgi:glutathione S-transferase
MKLFYSSTSPYARKVRVLALELGLGDGLELIEASPLSNPPALLAANPLGKIPALVRDDGSVLFDSPVICEFLAAGNEAVLPSDGEARWTVLRLQALADGLMDAAFSRTMELRRPETERSPSWIARWSEGIVRAVAQARPGDGFGLGEIALATALGYLDFRCEDLQWRSHAPELSDWYARHLARPSLAKTAPP